MKNITPKHKIKRAASAPARHDFVGFIEMLIEHKMFRPVTISIIVCFLLFNGINFVKAFIADKQEQALLKKEIKPIKITITKEGKEIDFNEIQRIEYRVKTGDTMLKYLMVLGAPESDVFAILAEMKKYYDPKDITVGDSVFIKYKLKITQDDLKNQVKSVEIDEVKINPAPEREVTVTRDPNNSYSAKEVKQNLTSYIVKYSGVIKNGLYVDGVNAGISPTSMMNMIGLYSYDVDFQRDLHEGDKFEVLVESYYAENGRKIKDGNVLFSGLNLNGKPIEIYAHKVGASLEYFDGKGNSVKKSLLRTPVNGARISSGFGFRKHPILGYSKLHKGIDFAAPSGTPIFAAGNGVITFMGRQGGYGNFVKIKHNSEYETQYGHASGFSRKFHVGSKVRQGDVVAYVGSTGRSTGPHLHYEIVYKGQAINPSSVKSVSGIRLGGAELAKFNATKNKIDGYRQKAIDKIKG